MKFFVRKGKATSSKGALLDAIVSSEVSAVLLFWDRFGGELSNTRTSLVKKTSKLILSVRHGLFCKCKDLPVGAVPQSPREAADSWTQAK